MASRNTIFKSCDYCRHRKKRCLILPGAARCSDCQHLDLACEFSPRQPSEKRRAKSRRLAALVRAPSTSPQSENGDDREARDREIEEANLKQGDCQLPLAGRRDMANKRLFRRPTLEQETASPDGIPSLSELYWKDVHPFWPFATPEMLDYGATGRFPEFMRCVDLACRLSVNHLGELEDLSQQVQEVTDILRHTRLSMPMIAGALLLSTFLYIEDELLQKIFDYIKHEHAYGANPVPSPILAGTLLTNVWRRLAGHSHPPLQLPSQILLKHADTLDPERFGHHYLRFSRHATEFDQLRVAYETEGIQPNTVQAWARLEYECLLWQVCLPPTLLDTRDDLPATPESVVIHGLSNLLLLRFYSFVLEHADILGSAIALRPVPGVLIFMCVLARSSFICPHALLDRMSLLVDIQAQIVRIMLQLWHQAGFENCRGILNLWDNPDDKYPELALKVREVIGNGPWAVEEVDGYSVFWTFRDLRTLTTKFIFSDRV